MHDAVHLTGARCDGSGHDGCQAACLLYWKTAWLRPMPPNAPIPVQPPSTTPVPALLTDATRDRGPTVRSSRYRCQATEMLRAAPEPLPTPRPHAVRRRRAHRERRRRAGRCGRFPRGRCTTAFRTSDSPIPAESAATSTAVAAWGVVTGTAVGRTPTERSNLQPGELVRIKSRNEVERDARPRPAQPWARFRRRDGALLRHHGPRRQTCRPHHRREQRDACST